MVSLFPREGSFLALPEDLLLPTDGSVHLPKPKDIGIFLVSPDSLWLQILLGNRNPSFNQAIDQDEAVKFLSLWRQQAIDADEAARNGVILGSEDFPAFHHPTNTLARIACHPVRDATYSLKDVFQAEEAAFPDRSSGRDPE